MIFIKALTITASLNGGSPSQERWVYMAGISSGNKRIGAFMFIWFLEKNKHLLKKSGELKINDNALTALALLVAQSDPSEKELMIKLICNLVTDY